MTIFRSVIVTAVVLLISIAAGAVELQHIHPLTSKSAYYMAPRWSPDGRLYCSSPKYAEILEINLENGAIKPIASGMGVGFKFAFAPDGSLIFKKISDDGRELWRVDPLGNKTLLASDREIGLPEWYNGAIRARFSQGVLSWNASGDVAEGTADGWVYQDGGGIFRYRSEQSPQRISPVGLDCCLPVQSPDGMGVIYESISGGLMYVNLETGATTGLGPGNNAQWSPDGSFFVFDRSTDDGHRLLSGDIILMKRDDPTPQNLTEQFDGIATQPTISPNGKRIAFEADGRIYVGDLIW